MQRHRGAQATAAFRDGLGEQDTHSHRSSSLEVAGSEDDGSPVRLDISSETQRSARGAELRFEARVARNRPLANALGENGASRPLAATTCVAVLTFQMEPAIARVKLRDRTDLRTVPIGFIAAGRNARARGPL